MSEIIPSTKLKVVTVHKIWDTVCMRKYFWNRVMNLEPRRINMDFWYGGVLGAGWEAFMLGKKLPQVCKVMLAESRRRTRRHQLDAEETAEIEFQMKLITLFISGAMRQRRKDFDASKLKMNEPQQVVRYQLTYSDVTYCGTADGIGSYKNRPCMFEFKTAKYINSDYLNKIAFDMQIHSYANGLAKQGILTPKLCYYLIFGKTSKIVKRRRGQTSDGFLREIANDIVTDPKKFFVLHEHRFSPSMLNQVAGDVEAAAWRLSMMYDNMTEAQLLDPTNWDRQSQQCLHFGACPYLMLCSNLQSWKVCERLYQQRELMYEEEQDELQT